jgi:hypothetical protein
MGSLFVALSSLAAAAALPSSVPFLSSAPQGKIPVEHTVRIRGK